MIPPVQLFFVLACTSLSFIFTRIKPGIKVALDLKFIFSKNDQNMEDSARKQIKAILVKYSLLEKLFEATEKEIQSRKFSAMISKNKRGCRK